MRFFDTMGVHIALAGFTNAQRGISLKYTAAEKRTPSAAEAARKRAIVSFETGLQAHMKLQLRTLDSNMNQDTSSSTCRGGADKYHTIPF